MEVGPEGARCRLRGAGAGGAAGWTLEFETRAGTGGGVAGASAPWAPEGWLGRLGGPLGLLPCRYAVQAMGAPAAYTLSAPAGLATLGGHTVEAQGEGLLHVETNYGESFPEGWLYAQGCGDRGARLVLTGGRFRIGPAAPMTWLLCLRLPGLDPLEFRTTDLDVVRVRILNFEDKELFIEAERPAWGNRGGGGYGGPLHASVRLTAPRSTFGADGGLYVPTPGGFSRSPGAVESFVATARVRVRGLPGGAEGEFTLPGCALEFGGLFQDAQCCEAAEDTDTF